jgi:biotin operon repressor
MAGVAALDEDDQLSVPDLQEATGLSRPTVYRALERLREAGLAVNVERGQWRGVHQDLGAAAVAVGAEGLADRQRSIGSARSSGRSRSSRTAGRSAT